MNIEETAENTKTPGGSIDSWCGKCKLVLAHTIEAMVGDKPARVQCNTCRAQHAYKPHPPGGAPRQRSRKASAGAGSRAARPRATRYETLLKDKDVSTARRYSSTDTYSPGDLMEHPKFGFGVATDAKDGTKIEVLFESGSKVLIHGR